MVTRAQRTERRADALSRERIVAAAIEILDEEGEGALTFRALAARLATGSGAIYWHVSGKDELLAAAASAVIARTVAGTAPGPQLRETGPREAGPREAIRASALALFDVVDTHPWLGAQLSREPWQPAIAPILESMGGPLQALGVPPRAQFDAASALVNYILGLAGQYAAGARLLPRETDRTAFLASIAAQWAQLDPARYPFVHQVMTQLPGHDDRAQFLAGLDIILAGLAALR